MEPVEYGQLRLVSSDSRRDIREFSFKKSNVILIVVKDGSKPIGQHFHRKVVETFCLLEGGGIVRTVDLNQKGEPIGKTQTFALYPGFVIRIPPYQAHRFDLEAGTRMLMFASRPFDAEDLIACPIS